MLGMSWKEVLIIEFVAIFFVALSIVLSVLYPARRAMSIEPVPDMMPKIKALKALLEKENPGCLIEVDGGVDESTCVLCKESGADVLVAGSAYFKAADRKGFVKAIQK